METNTKALETVCRHFKAEFGDKTISNLRKRVNKAHAANYRLRRKIANLDSMLQIQKSLTMLMQSFVTSLMHQFNNLAKRILSDDPA